MSFYLVSIHPDGLDGYIEKPMPDYGPYENGAEAAKKAKELSFSTGIKVQPRRIAQATDWRAFHQEKMDNGTYSKLPAEWDLPPIDGHFAHRWSKDETMIAFFESEEKAIINRETALKPGGYITRFYPDTSEADLRRLISTVDLNGVLFFARTPQEIEEVYTTGPNSCMAHPKSRNWPNHPMHPVGVYGAGDLAIAYTKTKNGGIQSRALVWPDRKVHGRVYGDFDRMIAALEGAGYSYDQDGEHDDDNGDFVGAKILHVPFRQYNENYVVLPYFDNMSYVTRREGEEHWTVCGGVPDGEEGVYYAGGGGTEGRAAEQRYCPRYGTFVASSGFAPVHIGNGKTQDWSAVAIENYAFTCRITKERWRTDEGLVVRSSYNRASIRISPNAIDETFVDPLNNLRYFKTEGVQASDEIWVRKDQLDTYEERLALARETEAKKAAESDAKDADKPKRPSRKKAQATDEDVDVSPATKAPRKRTAKPKAGDLRLTA